MARRFLSLFCPTVTSSRLTQLVEWCDRYSPLAAADGSDGVILDITGCAHLFGGEGALLLDVQRRLRGAGIRSRGAIADACGIAWALARYSKKSIVHGEKSISALDPLPVEALRLPHEIVLELRRLGLSTISTVRKLPRHSLAARFGSSLLWRLDRTFHQAEEPLTPWRPPASHRASRVLGEPISTTGSVEYVLRDLLQEICGLLDTNRLGSRHMDFSCYRVDGTVDRCEVRTSKPTRSVPHLMRLFEGATGKLRADFGFEAFVLSVLDKETLYPAQLSLLQEKPVEDESSFDSLIDRFSMKLGFQEVNRIQVRESLLPEHAVEFHPAIASGKTSAEWPRYRVRPVRLIDPPKRIKVSVLIPGESPVQFLIGSQKYRIVRCEGPERLTAEWWRTNTSLGDSRTTDSPDTAQSAELPRLSGAASGGLCTSLGTRDYYRIEDDRGCRFWIFRDSSDCWFLQGQLP